MARKKEIIEEISHEAVKPKRKPRKKKEVISPACWEICSNYVANDGSDYVHICLGNVFVTYAELIRMTGEINQKEQE